MLTLIISLLAFLSSLLSNSPLSIFKPTSSLLLLMRNLLFLESIFSIFSYRFRYPIKDVFLLIFLFFIKNEARGWGFGTWWLWSPDYFLFRLLWPTMMLLPFFPSPSFSWIVTHISFSASWPLLLFILLRWLLIYVLLSFWNCVTLYLLNQSLEHVKF